MSIKNRCIEVITVALVGGTLPSLAWANAHQNSEPEDEELGEDEEASDEEASDDEESDSSFSAEASFSTEDGANANADRSDKKWIHRWPPEAGMWELGLYGGVLLPNKNHEWFGADKNLPEDGFKKLKPLSPDFGARIGYYPLSFLGIEAEGGVMPSKVDEDDQSALLYTARGHLLAQIPKWSITPFIVAGAGMVGVASDRDALGNDVDLAMHFGGGVKVYFNKYVAMRLDLRDILSLGRGEEAKLRANNFEALLGLSITLGRKDPERKGPIDTDGDGIYDPDDQCVNDPETVNDFQDEDGCPESDRDGDGFWDEPDMDECPDEAGVEPDGCPVNDKDGDGIMDDDDQCVDDPETKNGYEDEDGCPDELPKEVEKFNGVIRGIYFDTDKDTIKAKSETVLKKAVKVLKKFPNIRVKITGHTDSKGGYDHNMDLSKRRAASVKNYLVEHGIDEDRLETDGVGPDEPIDTNATKAGRAKNRRIEFAVQSD